MFSGRDAVGTRVAGPWSECTQDDVGGCQPGEVSVTLTVEGRDEAEVDKVTRRNYATVGPASWRIDRTDAMTYEELEENPRKRAD